jgi:subtilisin-like proprotein convertase family protein
MKKQDNNGRASVSRFVSTSVTFLMLISLALNPILGLGQSRAPRTAEVKAEGPASSPNPLVPLTVFSNPAAINLPDSQLTSVSSNITVSGTSGPISSITLTVTNFTASQGAADFDLLLVGPGGQKFMVMSDVGGNFDPMTNANITLSDAAAGLLPNTGAIVSGTFRPTDYGANANLPPAAPAGPYSTPATAGAATFTSVFGGLSGASVNGTWTLWVADDTGSGGTGASIAGGWSMDIVTTPAALPTTTTIASSLNPSFTNQAVTFTSNTTSSSTVNTGVVNFVDTTTGATLCASVPVNSSGVATCLAAANTLSERRHTIQATYVGNASFSTSNGSLVQTVNFPTSRVGNTFTNAGGISIPDVGGTSIPYPSNIIVSALTGTISKVTLTLTNATFPQTADYNFLLVGPGGQTFLFMSDAGGAFNASTGVTLTFDDAALNPLPNSGSIATGSYRPTDYSADSDFFPAPAPPAPYNAAAPAGVATFASLFGGAAPNGTWSLYPIDDTGGGTGSVGSWSLTFITSGDAPTTTVISGSPNPATTAQSVLYTATVTSSGSPVTVGNVTFRRGATVVCANVPLNGSGVATCNQPALPQGDYVVTADYNGSPGAFNISSGSFTLMVNSPTVVTCNNFANNGGITVTNASIGSPYPSRILVNGLGGTITKVTLSLNGLTTPNPDDLDLLLVGPGGQTFVFMSDAGGNNAITGVNLTFDDAAATQIPNSTIIASGTFRPGSYTGGSDAFPAPAPAGPYNLAATDGVATFATVYNGISPNGSWSLYSIEDTGDAVNTTLTGWSLPRQ